MNKNIDNSVSLQLFELCNEFYKYEQQLLIGIKEKSNICYLIDSKSIDFLKKQINYDELKKYFENEISKEKFKEKVKGFKIKNKIDLFPEKFKTSDDLIKSLNDGNKYYYITQSFFSKIYKKKNFEKHGIKYLLYENKIEFFFNDNDIIKFYTDLSGLIKIDLLIKDTQTSNINSNGKHQKNEKNVKNNLEILIRLFYYNKFLKEKDNSEFKPIKKENFLSVYLINNDLLEQFKSFYDYNELEKYLLQSKNESCIIDVDFITEQSIQKIISTLPDTYIKKLENKKKFDKFHKKINRYDNDKIIGEKNGTKPEISYLINNQIINKKIHDALMNAEYETPETSLKNCYLYFIGNKRIIKE